jgi:hypothetical protein
MKKSKRSNNANNKQSKQINQSNNKQSIVFSDFVDHRTYKQFTDTCLAGDLENVKLLLSKNKELINYQPPQQLFDMICQYGYKNIAEYIYNFVSLSNTKQKINISSNDDYPLIMAATCGSLELVKWLHEAGADISTQDDAIFRIACQNNYADLIDWLSNKTITKINNNAGCLYYNKETAECYTGYDATVHCLIDANCQEYYNTLCINQDSSKLIQQNRY